MTTDKVLKSRLAEAIAKEGLELNEPLMRAMQLMEVEGRSIFIHGRAGTGKSTLLQLFRSITQKNTAVVAPTGAAAINVGGQTLHSFFRFPPRSPSSFEIRRTDREELYRDLDALVVDEVSMVRADLMDAIDKFLRVNRRIPEIPFGGVQMILIGDLCQLPPVVANETEERYLAQNHGTAYFFGAEALRHAAAEGDRGLETVELETIYRQRDAAFVSVLNSIRYGTVTEEGLALLNERVDASFVPQADDSVVLLTPTNAVADRENARRLSQIQSRAVAFPSSSTEKFQSVPERNLPAPSALHLKVGAHVMFVRNDRDRQWVNGTIGQVTEIEPDAIRVLITDSPGGHVWVEPETWEMNEYVHDSSGGSLDTEVVGTFTQFPLRLGYAITVHKSQGKTLERAVVDMGRGAFAHGQTYVALSRVRSLSGLVLTRPITAADVFIDPVVVDFLDRGVIPEVGQGNLFR